MDFLLNLTNCYVTTDTYVRIADMLTVDFPYKLFRHLCSDSATWLIVIKPVHVMYFSCLNALVTVHFFETIVLVIAIRQAADFP